MKRLVKTGVFMMLVLMTLASQKNVAEAKTKVIHKKMTIDLQSKSSSQKQEGAESESKRQKIHCNERKKRR